MNMSRCANFGPTRRFVKSFPSHSGLRLGVADTQPDEEKGPHPDESLHIPSRRKSICRLYVSRSSPHALLQSCRARCRIVPETTRLGPPRLTPRLQHRRESSVLMGIRTLEDMPPRAVFSEVAPGSSQIGPRPHIGPGVKERRFCREVGPRQINRHVRQKAGNEPNQKTGEEHGSVRWQIAPTLTQRMKGRAWAPGDPLPPS